MTEIKYKLWQRSADGDEDGHYVKIKQIPAKFNADWGDFSFSFTSEALERDLERLERDEEWGDDQCPYCGLSSGLSPYSFTQTREELKGLINQLTALLENTAETSDV